MRSVVRSGSGWSDRLIDVAIEALLLDIDGVLTVSWEPLPGAIDALARLRGQGVALRLITNTTTKTRADLGATLRSAGFDVADEEIVTAVVATAAHLRNSDPHAKVFVLSDGDATADLDGVRLVGVDDADVIVLGGASDDFSYDTMNRIFRRLMDGARLVGMHRNLFWKTEQGWQLDGGAYLAGLEEAAGVHATICGKPAEAFFTAALDELRLGPDRAAMVGDDVLNDVVGAKAVGLTGILVRTGKYRPGDETEHGVEPDHVVESIATIPDLMGEGER
jgi:HAD superfamily hydrolase (TIGR01458 family)